MKILHYCLGFPPYRTGGLTKFCMDLVKEQIREGHQTAVMWPGEVRSFSGKTKIRKGIFAGGIISYEVINPLPMPYDEGIKEIGIFTSEGNTDAYDCVFDEFRPDVIHVHTLMGLHKSFLLSANRKGIHTVFTTHDFFPICAKVKLFRNGEVCRDAESCRTCPECNITALSKNKLMLLQSPLYRQIKQNRLIEGLRKRHRNAYFESTMETESGDVGNSSRDYLLLRNFYKEELKLIDCIHYNSSVAKNIYDKYMGVMPGEVLPITHADIADHRKRKKAGNILKIAYLSPPSGAKGYFVLRKVLDRLWKQTHDFVLNVYFTPTEDIPYIRSHPPYQYSELGKVMDQADVVIAPSIWYETFGYTVLEALSFGAPVIVSSHVGAKDIIPDGAGIIYKDSDELFQLLQSLEPEKINQMNEIIMHNFNVPVMNEFCRDLIEKCYE